MAERERERAHDPQPVREVDDRTCLLRDKRGLRGLEDEDLDLVLRPLAVEQVPVEVRTASARRRPLLLGPEVVDESERDVAHRRTVGDGDRH